MARTEGILTRFPKLAILVAFEAFLRDVRSFSPNTLKAYLADLTFFAEALAAEAKLEVTGPESEILAALYARAANPQADNPHDGVTTRICTATREQLRNYLLGLHQGNGLSASTVNRRQATLYTFYKWAARQGLVLNNPAIKLGLRKLETVHLHYVTDEEFEKLVLNLRGADWKRQRDTAMFMLMREAGLHSGEVCALNEGDLLEGTLKVLRPGRRSRERVLSSKLLSSLEVYRAAKAAGSRPETPLFANKHGGRLSARSFRRHFNVALGNAGLPLSIRPVDLRYTAIINDLALGTDLVEVASMHGVLDPAAVIRRFGAMAEKVRSERNSKATQKVPEPEPAPPMSAAKRPVPPNLTSASASSARPVSPYGRATPLRATQPT